MSALGFTSSSLLSPWPKGLNKKSNCQGYSFRAFAGMYLPQIKLKGDLLWKKHY